MSRSDEGIYAAKDRTPAQPEKTKQKQKLTDQRNFDPPVRGVST